MLKLSPYAAVVPLLFLTSCFAVTHDYAGPHEVTPGTQLSVESASLGRVSDRKKAHFLLWGIVPLNDVSAPQRLDAAAVAAHGDGVRGVTQVRIHEEQDALDIVVEILTLGIFSMVTVESQGEVRGVPAGGAQ